MKIYNNLYSRINKLYYFLFLSFFLVLNPNISSVMINSFVLNTRVNISKRNALDFLHQNHTINIIILSTYYYSKTTHDKITQTKLIYFLLIYFVSIIEKVLTQETCLNYQLSKKLNKLVYTELKFFHLQIP